MWIVCSCSFFSVLRVFLCCLAVVNVPRALVILVYFRTLECMFPKLLFLKFHDCIVHLFIMNCILHLDWSFDPKFGKWKLLMYVSWTESLTFWFSLKASQNLKWWCREKSVLPATESGVKSIPGVGVCPVPMWKSLIFGEKFRQCLRFCISGTTKLIFFTQITCKHLPIDISYQNIFSFYKFCEQKLL